MSGTIQPIRNGILETDLDLNGFGFQNTGGVNTGDFSTNTSTSVDGELVLFSGTTGKLGKRGILPSANGLTLLGHTFAQMRTDLGLVIGTNVQAFDADLTTWAGLTPSANAQSLVTAANYAAMRTLLGLVIGTNVQAFDAELTAIAGLTSAADRVPYFTGSGTASLATFTAAGRTLVGLSNSASLVTLAGVTPSPTGLNLIVLGTPDFDSYLKITTAGGTVMESPTQVILDGGGAFTGNPLSQFAATTSAQLASVISDETGTGSLVFATAPTFADTVTLNSTSASPTFLLNISGVTMGRLMTAHVNGSGSDFATIGDVILRSASPNDLILQARASAGVGGNVYISTGNPDVARLTVFQGGGINLFGTADPGTGKLAIDTLAINSFVMTDASKVLVSSNSAPFLELTTWLISPIVVSPAETDLKLYGGSSGENPYTSSAHIEIGVGLNANVLIVPSGTGQTQLTGGMRVSGLSTNGFVKTTGSNGTFSVDTATYEPALGNPGTDGFVLSSTAAGVRSWIASSAAAVATDAIWDAKGDLAIGTGANTAARLAIGANDTIAIADSTQTTGIRWGIPASIRTALGLVIGTDVQAFDADLTTWAGLTPSANAQSLVTAADYAAMRTLLGLVIGTNVQAWDADLDTWATKTPYAGALTITTGKTFNATNTLTLSGTDGSTLDVGAGGTLGSNAFNSTAYEPALGNPGTNGFVLSSTTGGTRSWVAQSGSVASTASVLKGDGAGGAVAVTWPVTLVTGTGAGTISQAPSGAVIAGSINTDAGAEPGGNIDTHGGGSSNAFGGDILTHGSVLRKGGSIKTNGGTLPGGDIYTADGGGSINTWTGIIQLGDNGGGNFTIINAGIPASNVTLTLPIVDTTLLGTHNIGSTIQAFDADLTSWAAITRASGFDTFTATPTLANLNTLVSDADVASLAGSETLTNKTLTTPVINGLPTGTGVASAATASTLVARDSNGDITTRDLITGVGRSVILRSGSTISSANTGLVNIVGAIVPNVQALSGAGAVNVTTTSTAYTSTGAAQALTLADGVSGQIKTIAHVSDGGSGVLTPTTKSGYSTITFTNVGDAVTLQFFTTAGWIIVGQNGVTVAP